MISCSTFSAMVRKKSGWPPFAASSSISNLSSVIGNSSSSRLKCANSTITMNPVATSDAAFRGGACPTPEYTIAYTGNYTTSADANRLWRVSVFQGNLWDREETNRRTDLKAQSSRNHRQRTQSETRRGGKKGGRTGRNRGEPE